MAPADTPRYQQWLQDMREQPRGPFSRVRWFCNDGTVLPPKAYACQPHGGGVQHGQWSERTAELREQGFLIASFLAGVEADEWLAEPNFDNAWGQLLIERFLVAADDGWILRQALTYRGAIQEEDERAGARALLLAMLSRDEWLGPHFLSLRTGVELLPHGADTASVGRVRQLSAALSDRDPSFMPVRIKIHGAPDGSDATTVRDYMAGVEDDALQARYAELADEIDQIYQAEPLPVALAELAGQSWMPGQLAASLRGTVADWQEVDALGRMEISGALLLLLRRELPAIPGAQRRLQVLDFGLQVEAEHFRAAAEVRKAFAGMSRAELIKALGAAANAAFGTGLLNERLHMALSRDLARMAEGPVKVGEYKASLTYLSRAPGWGHQALRRYYYLPMLKLGEIEPLALLFIQDRLRGSPLLFYSQVLNLLARDAGNLAGVRHRVFGKDVGAGFNALNPGLSRGVLRVSPALDDPHTLREDGIYVLPETVAELPPVAGILTAGAGNPLSHVQLLARNLGIPNVSVDRSVIERLASHDGRSIVLAVSPGGLVEISDDGPQWDAVFAQQAQSAVRIEPDLQKLDLTMDSVVSIDDLSAEDSGRSVGPKAAKLAELRKHYPEAVSRGIAIPFGVFKAVALDQPYPQGGTLFQWMQREYSRLGALPEGSGQRAQETEVFRAELHQRLLDTRFPESFRDDLGGALDRVFGGRDTGLFVRSDTNVEDLAGFTGAGLNLTLPNVIGFDNLLDGIRQVWASPFTARAFSWRQSHMSAPEHVYTSILLLESVGSDKSGVLITADIDSGARDVLSVAVNEGLGGAVDGQAAESLRIPMDGGPERVLATATAPTRRLLNPAGGILEVASSGGDYVLRDAEMAALTDFARSLPERFPPITDDAGKPVPADVEFGFLAGSFRLFQLRPFLDSAAAAGNTYLRGMDARSSSRDDLIIDMKGEPTP